MFPIIQCAGTSCNVRCEYCWFHENNQTFKRGAVMPDTVLRALVTQLLDINPSHCSFLWHGGEPLLAGISFFKRAIQFQKQFNVGGAEIENSIQTNGTCITECWVTLFKENNFKVGVSLDGPEHIHNRHRTYASGNGSFRDALRGMRRCQQYGIDVGVIAVVTAQSAAFPEEIYRFFRSNHIQSMTFNPAFDRGADGSVAPHSVSDDSFSKFLGCILDLWLAEDNPDVVIRQFTEPMKCLLGGKPTTCIYSGTCSDFLTIDASGAVRTCHSTKDGKPWYLGNIQEAPLRVLVRMEEYGEFERWVRAVPDECVSCGWFSLCNDGCVDHRILENGDSDNSGKYIFCGSRKLVFQRLKSVVDAVRYNGVT